MTPYPPASDPAYLRDLAHKFRSKGPAHAPTADRLENIAHDLERLLTPAADPPAPTPSRLATGTDIALARIRAAQRAPAPTPAQLEELRNLRKQEKL
jgi:hypothetical protein